MLEAVPWENPTYGILGGAAGNVAYGGTVNPPRNRKGGAGNPPPTGARASALPNGGEGGDGSGEGIVVHDGEIVGGDVVNGGHGTRKVDEKLKRNYIILIWFYQRKFHQGNHFFTYFQLDIEIYL